MFRFLHKYADAVGARRPLLGRNGPVMPDGTRRKIMQDVYVSDLPEEVLNERPIEKIGLYFQDAPYFLESRHGDEAFEIPRPAKRAFLIKRRMEMI